MIYLSAGHHFNQAGADPGAIGVDGAKEADLTKELRDLVAAELIALGAKYILDDDSETLSQYIRRIKPGSGSVVCELHFNSSAGKVATGFECVIKNTPTIDERRLANKVCEMAHAVLGIYNRGVKTEAQTHRGKLGILNTRAGISILPEICFINNPEDMRRYHTNKKIFAYRLALLLNEFDNIYK